MLYRLDTILSASLVKLVSIRYNRGMEDPRLHLVLERLSNVLREDLRAVATKHGLALAQLEALHFLATANRYSDTLSAIVEFLGATKGTVSQTVTALERKGLVVREPDPADRRVQHCKLTAAGRAVVRESLPAPVLRGLNTSPDALEALLTALIRARGGRAFGVCRTCAHFRAQGPRCGLVNEPLTTEDAEKVCREHEPALAG